MSSNWAISTVEAMTAEELSRNPRLCIGDSDFDELERLLGLGRQPQDSSGNRCMNYKGAVIYTHHVNRLKGIR